MKFLKILLIFLIISSNFKTDLFAVKNYGDAEVEKINNIHDGDTFNANLKNMPPIIGEKIGIRIDQIDTPEITSKNPNVKKLALLAKEFTSDQLTTAKKVQLKNIRRDKYFRILAEVLVDGKNLGIKLIQAGLAVAYDGKQKPNWEEILAKS